MSELNLKTCPKCNYQFNKQDYIGTTVICSSCNSHFCTKARSVSLWAKHHKKIVSLVLIIGALNFTFLVAKNWDRLLKKESPISSFIKQSWNDLNEEKLARIILKCQKNNDFKCQMLAYQRLVEIDPSSDFYKRTYEAKLKKYKNPPRIELPEDIF